MEQSSQIVHCPQSNELKSIFISSLYNIHISVHIVKLMFGGHRSLCHISILLHLPFVTALPPPSSTYLTLDFCAELQKPVCADWRVWVVGSGLLSWKGVCSVCACAAPACAVTHRWGHSRSSSREAASQQPQPLAP